MKALSLTQPWATLMVIGAKRIETRSWRTRHAGPLAIHAAKSFPKWARALCLDEPFASALERALGRDYMLNLPTGAVLGHVDLWGCLSTLQITTGQMLKMLNPPFPWSDEEYHFGDYSHNRWGWLTSNAFRFRDPIPARGALSLWEWDENSVGLPSTHFAKPFPGKA